MSCSVEEIGICEHHTQDAEVHSDRPVVCAERPVDTAVGLGPVVLSIFLQALKYISVVLGMGMVTRSLTWRFPCPLPVLRLQMHSWGGALVEVAGGCNKALALTITSDIDPKTLTQAKKSHYDYDMAY